MIEANEAEPTWAEKIALISQLLRTANVPFAFGGAIALNYHRDPRSTLDIDINIFLPPAKEDRVINVLKELYGLPDRDQLVAQFEERGQGRSIWGTTFIDLFFADTEFHQSMASRTVEEEFGEIGIPVLSIEDLIVCKALFNRPKDWLDIDAVAATNEPLDLGYINRWVTYFIEPSDPEYLRLQSILGP